MLLSGVWFFETECTTLTKHGEELLGVEILHSPLSLEMM